MDITAIACFNFGDVGNDDIPILKLRIFGDTMLGGSLILGDVGCGEPGDDCKVGDVFVDSICSHFGTKITDAKLSSESTLVSLCKLLSLDESEPSSLWKRKLKN